MASSLWKADEWMMIVNGNLLLWHDRTGATDAHFVMNSI